MRFLHFPGFERPPAPRAGAFHFTFSSSFPDDGRAASGASLDLFHLPSVGDGRAVPVTRRLLLPETRSVDFLYIFLPVHDSSIPSILYSFCQKGRHVHGERLFAPFSCQTGGRPGAWCARCSPGGGPGMLPCWRCPPPAIPGSGSMACRTVLFGCLVPRKYGRRRGALDGDITAPAGELSFPPDQ